MNLDLQKLDDFECLVVSGGGIRGIAISGALDVLEEHDCLENVKIFIGTSIGAMITCMLSIGYKSKELYDLLYILNWKDYRNIKISNLPKYFGLDDAKKIMNKIKDLFKKKLVDPTLTFQELFELNGNLLIIPGTNICTHNINYFSKENTPDMPILDAVRISITLPVLFTSPLYKGDFYVDGGLLDNFATSQVPKGKKTLGIKLNNSYEIKGKKVKIQKGQFDEFFLHTIYTLIDDNNRLRTENGLLKRQIAKMENNNENNNENTNIYHIEIVTKSISSFDMKLSDKQKEYLYECGRHHIAVWLEEKIEKIREFKSTNDKNSDNI